jgi:hypothetical protein
MSQKLEGNYNKLREFLKKDEDGFEIEVHNISAVTLAHLRSVHDEVGDKWKSIHMTFD